MTFNILINDPKIREACGILNKYSTDTKFLQEICAVYKFSNTLLSSEEVAIQLSKIRGLQIIVQYYTPIWRFSKAIARADYKCNVIEFNKYIDAPVEERVITLYHECCHILGFEHKGNTLTSFNRNTVPYLASRIFIKYLKNNNYL